MPKKNSPQQLRDTINELFGHRKAIDDHLTRKQT